MDNDSNNTQEERTILRVEEVLESTDDNEAIYVPGSSTEDRWHTSTVNAIADSNAETGLWGIDWNDDEPTVEDGEDSHILVESYGDWDLDGNYVCGLCISSYYLDQCREDGTLGEYAQAVVDGQLLNISMVPLDACTCQDSDDADPDWSPMEVDSDSYSGQCPTPDPEIDDDVTNG